MMAPGTFDNSNGGRWRQRLAGRGRRPSLRHPDVAALDEVSTEYGLLAEAVSHPEDFASVTYRLRANAKWHDGKPVTSKT